MAERKKVVAVLIANPALNSILTMVLAGKPALRVRPFESLHGLTTYMRIAPVDLIVADFDCEDEPADVVSSVLRADPLIENTDFQMIALAGRVTSTLKTAARRAKIDEIMVKPMSPRYLLERVVARLGAGQPLPPRIALGEFGGNVIPLFPRSHTLH